jgi:hypothetical protein
MSDKAATLGIDGIGKFALALWLVLSQLAQLVPFQTEELTTAIRCSV